MSDPDPIGALNGVITGESGQYKQDEKTQAPIKLRFKNVGKSNLSKAAHPIPDEDPNIEEETPQSTNLGSNDASPSAISVDEQDKVHSPEAQSKPLNSASRPPPPPFNSAASHPLTQLPCTSPIPLLPAVSISTSIPAPSRPLDVASNIQQPLSLSAPAQNLVPLSHPTPRRRPPVPSLSLSLKQQRRLDTLKTNMPSQEEELARIRQNMAFLNSDPEPKMDNDLNIWARRQFTDKERHKLRGIVQYNSPLAMAIVMDSKRNIGSSMHQSVPQSMAKTADEKRVEEAKARIQKALNKFRPSSADLAQLTQIKTHPESQGMSPRDSSLKSYSDIQDMPSKEFTPHHAAYPQNKFDVSASTSASQFTYPHRAASKAFAGAPSELINPTRLRPGRGIDRDSGLTTEEAKAKEKVAEALAEYDDDYEENLEEMERYLAVPERKR